MPVQRKCGRTRSTSNSTPRAVVSPCGVPNSTRWPRPRRTAARVRGDLLRVSRRSTNRSSGGSSPGSQLERRVEAGRRPSRYSATSAPRARARRVAVLVDDGHRADDDARRRRSDPLAHQPRRAPGSPSRRASAPCADLCRERGSAPPPRADQERHLRPAAARTGGRLPGASEKALALEPAAVAGEQPPDDLDRLAQRSQRPRPRRSRARRATRPGRGRGRRARPRRGRARRSGRRSRPDAA